MAASACTRLAPVNQKQLAQLRRQCAARPRERHKYCTCADADGAAAAAAAASMAMQSAATPATQQAELSEAPTASTTAAATSSQLQPAQLDLCLPDAQHVWVVRNFFEEAEQLREQYEERMLLDPLRPEDQRTRWDSILMPRKYRLMRTPANAFFPAPLLHQLRGALESYGACALGCPAISPIWLSYYIDNCRQNWLCAAPSGPFAFVLSLTRWEGRAFSGGEIMLLQQPSAFETDETTLIDPEFNSLVLWDNRTPHGVCEVKGTDDPLEGRVVLQGWFREPQRLYQGSLTEAEAGPALDACVEAAHAAISQSGLPPASGTVVLRLEVAGDSGRVTSLHWLVNTLVGPPPINTKLGRSPPPWAVTEAALLAIGECCAAARLPPSSDGGGTSITLPFVFP